MEIIELAAWVHAQSSMCQPTFVVLLHVGPGGRLTPANRWAYDERARSDPQALCAEIVTFSQDWTDKLSSGPQRFSLQLVDSSKEPLATYVFLRGTDTIMRHPLDTEPATSEGLVKQCMRHVEVLMRTSVASSQSLVHENERLRERLDRLEGRHSETVSLQEELMAHKHERELATIRVMNAEKRKEQAFNKATGFGQLLVTRLLSQGTQGDPAVASLAESLTPEQLQQLMTVFRPDQLFQLKGIFDHHVKATREAAAKSGEAQQAAASASPGAAA